MSRKAPEFRGFSAIAKHYLQHCGRYVKMAFCQNCGHKLDPAAKFCPECGEPVVKKDMSIRHQKFAGEIIKCPNCGEPLNAFVSQCPACGYELRGSDSSDSVKEFVQELKNIETERKNDEGGIKNTLLQSHP